MNLIEEKLFETNAMKVSDADKPFWYTSGKLGPYFINTHFLYGSEKDAGDLLNLIDTTIDEPVKLIKEMEKQVLDFYKTNKLYKDVIDYYLEQLNKNKLFVQSGYISGGERRDWFFSIIIANLTSKKHLYILKNKDIYLDLQKINDINGAEVCHIADLITEASSYERAWIPAIESVNGKITFTSSIVDRCQGGMEVLAKYKIPMYSPVKIDSDFFKGAADNKIITKAQEEMIKHFTVDPDDFGIKFIMNNPDFLKSSLNSDNKSTKSKAERCISENPYNMDFTKLGLTKNK